MKLSTAKIFLIILLCLSLFSCKKKIDDAHLPQFIGYWYCPPNTYSAFGYTIYISSDGHGVYQVHDGLQIAETIQGTARANAKKLKIGRIYGFDITEMPQKIDTASSTVHVPLGPDTYADTTIKANWVMILGQYPAIYYKADY